MLAQNEAFQRVLDAYGGLALWRTLKHVVVQLDSLGGPLPRLKGLRRTFLSPRLLLVDPVHRKVEFLDYPKPGERTIFAAGAVLTVDRAGAPVFERSGYRETLPA
jgi:hypothetical protein